MEGAKDLSTNIEKSMSRKFMDKVILEFANGVGDIALTEFQKRLAQNYFISIDASLKMAEEKRLKKTRNQDKVPVKWANVNLELLARNVVASARIGLDPAQKNHINTIPYKNNTTGKYDIGFIEGYRGMELKAKKYGLDIPDGVIVELVYSNDRFKSIKKDRNNSIESFEFEIVNDFDRGTVVGGFYYHIYKHFPEKNRLVVLTLKDIEKRKPAYASVEFWGGERDIWEDGKKTGKKELVEGWFNEMCWKTVYRAAYGSLTIDSQKIDDDYLRLALMEKDMKEAIVAAEVEVSANSEALDIEYEVDQEETASRPPDTVANPGF